ncbi:hypothetical protein [Alphaproteobacteria bacterium endosymbiont of Tiliacea citrago]|uniref:hypothetical protein n=1 Tax=Alphaproteobacteria bacterium endosymbiont of Tiliacea citrago TaxID=3077944 RepID=UPI00313BE456
MKHFLFFLLNHHLFSTNSGTKKTSISSIKTTTQKTCIDTKAIAKKTGLDSKPITKEALFKKIFVDPKYRNALFLKAPETFTEWVYFIKTLDALLIVLRLNILTNKDPYKEDFYMNLIRFLEDFTSFLNFEKDEFFIVPEMRLTLPNKNITNKFKSPDMFERLSKEIFEHVDRFITLLKSSPEFFQPLIKESRFNDHLTKYEILKTSIKINK